MQDLKVTLVQANQVWEDKEGNFENYSRLLTDIESDLIVLPEMFQTGFTMNTSGMGEQYSNSASLSWLKELAKEKNAAIYTSLIVKEESKFFNRGVFVEPDGNAHIYDKRKTFTLAKEDEFFANGEKETIVNYQGWRFQLQICYDLRFPEIVRNSIDSNLEAKYDVILYVANWPEKRSEHWQCLLRARAIENQSYVIGVNRVGSDQKGLTYSGDSKVINALGEEKKLTPSVEMTETFVINKQELNEIREMIPFLKDR
jgi:predicted amidohydrolase